MDAYIIYRERREQTPVYWDEERGLWALYSYRHCQQVLAHPAALIPPVADGELGGQALAVKRRLVRLSNLPVHGIARETALRMFRGRKPVDVGVLLGRLLLSPGSDATVKRSPGGAAEPDSTLTVEWVSAVARILPAMQILAGFGFPDGDVELLLRELPTVLTIMRPVDSPEAARALETAFERVYPLVDRQVAICFPGLTKEEQGYAVSNLIGLLIQSHDATKGLLSLALLHLLRRKETETPASREMDFFLSFVMEVMRYDSPVHTTRRLLTEDVIIGGRVLSKGATVLVAVAAANRDPAIFDRPEEFDRHRANNSSMLGFGHGIHGCIAVAYCTELVAQALYHLFHGFSGVELLETAPEYEPLANILMVKAMHVRLS